jgi:hypothetical protein
MAGALVTSAFGLLGGIVGLGLFSATTLAGVVGLASAYLLTVGGGAFGDFPERAMAIGFAAAGVAAVWSALLMFRRPAHGSTPDTALAAPGRSLALSAGVVSAALFGLELMALSHPAKPVIDAVFQAHRLEWVMAGRYFFTQPLPDGVAFPYAIGLFVSAAPLAALISDHVLVVRAVTLVAHAAAGLLLFALVASVWRAPRAGLAALVLYHAVPIHFVVIGNANLPNVFAQAVAVLALGGSVWLWPALPRGRRALVWAALVLLTALACLSHVSTLVLASGTLVSVALIMFALGGRGGRQAGFLIVSSLAIALVVAFALYYRHFPEVYSRAVSRVAGTETGSATAEPKPDAVERPAVLVRALSWREKAADARGQVFADLGWPVLLLAAVGAWRAWRERQTDRLTLLVIGWSAAWLAFLAVSTLTRVDTAYQRYAAEFIGRVNLAGLPAAILLAARAAAWIERARTPLAWRGLVALALGWALVIGARLWAGWIG